MVVGDYLKPNRRRLAIFVLLLIASVGLFGYGWSQRMLPILAILGILYLPALLLAIPLGGFVLQGLAGNAISAITAGMICLVYAYVLSCVIEYTFAQKLSLKGRKWAGGIVVGLILVVGVLVWWPPEPSVPAYAKDCGSEKAGAFDTLNSTGRFCFAEAIQNCEPATLESAQYTIEGDPIRYKYWLDNRCRFHVYVDSRDLYGTIGERYQICTNFSVKSGNITEPVMSASPHSSGIRFTYSNCTSQY